METKTIIGFFQVLFLLLFSPSRLFGKLQKEEWYFGPPKKWVGDLDIQPEMSVLEIGTGVGRLADFVSQQYGCGMTAIDISPGMLKKARNTIKSRVCLILASAEKLPFSNESFDVVFSSSLVNILPEPERALSEMLRVVKKGGMVSFLVPNNNMTVDNAKRVADQSGLKGFSKAALLFWASNAKKLSFERAQSILRKMNCRGKIEKNEYFFDMLMSVSLRK